MATKIKICTKCRKEKPIVDFRKDHRTKSGYGSICNICARRYEKEWREKDKKTRFCKDCGKNICKNSTGRCYRCAAIQREKKIDRFKKNNSQYVDGRSLINKFCPICGKKICYQSNFCSSCAKKGRRNPCFGKLPSVNAGNSKWGKYKNIFMRSPYEIIFAKWLDKRKIKWEYEYKRFNLGNTTYTPDFFLLKFNYYIEVKGYWRTKALEKFKMFKKKYNENIVVINNKNIQSIKNDIDDPILIEKLNGNMKGI